MARKSRHRKGGRVTPKATRPRGFAPPPQEPDPFDDIREVMADSHPLGLLGLVSSLLTALDPRHQQPFPFGLDAGTGTDDADEGPGLDELIQSFCQVDVPESTALLAAVGTLIGDERELTSARIRRELAGRSLAETPSWVSGLPGTEVVRAVEMVHAFGDGDNILLGYRLGTGEQLTAIVYIDHNMGTLVKDAFVLDQPIDELVPSMVRIANDPDTSWNDVDPADARARIDEAIERTSMSFPPIATETWPECRPIVEWLAGLLPTGGHGYQRQEWTQPDRDALLGEFFASEFGRGVDTPDHRELVDSILWFGTDYGPGDPLRWSPTSAEILLLDWIPRKIVAEPGLLTKLPTVLRAFVRFADAKRKIGDHLTAQTLEAIDIFEPEYQEAISDTSRPQGLDALLAAFPDFATDSGFDDELLSVEEIMLESLTDAVGGEAALDTLSAEQLPDEPFQWSQIPDDIRPRVTEILDFCDQCCDELLDVECRTACRRLLRRAAIGDPEVFRRKAKNEYAAAAICYVIAKANEMFSPNGDLLVKHLSAHFGASNSTMNQRANTLLTAAGLSLRGLDTNLGDPDLLVASHRQHIIELRDHYRSDL